MKNALFFFLMLTGMLVHPAIATPADTIGFNTIATGIKPGMMAVSSSEIIRDTQQLATYLSKVTIAANQLTEKPDFNSRLVVALAYNKGSRYYEFFQTITSIFSGDTIVILLRRDSTAITIDTSINYQPAYSIQLISIPKTDKPIICRYKLPTAVTDKPKYSRRMTQTRNSTDRTFDLTGRSFSTDKTDRVPGIIIHGACKKAAIRQGDVF